MYTRIKPTLTVYPCRQRSHATHADHEAESGVWMTWEGVEREHFSPHGSLVADFSKPREVEVSRVKNHRYVADELS
jgi:hypothetical protein